MKNKRNQHISILFIAFLMCGWLGFGLNDLRLGYNLNHYFSEASQEIDFYQKYKAHFSEENNFLMVSVRRKKTIDLQDFYEQVNQFSDSLTHTPGVVNVISPFNLTKTVKLPILGVRKTPVFVYKNEQKLEQSLRFIYDNPTVYQNFFSPDTNAVLIYLLIEPNLIYPQQEQLLTTINSCFQVLPDHEKLTLNLAGQTRTKVYYTQELKAELFSFSSMSLTILIILLIFIYRNAWLVLFSILSLAVATVIVLGLIHMFTGEMDFLKTMIPTIIFAIGVSNIIHVFSAYKQQKQQDVSPQSYTWKTVRKSTFISCFTTAIGFASFYVLPVDPVREFGFYSAIGIMITWGITSFFLTSLISLFDHVILFREKKNRRDRHSDNWFFAINQKRWLIISTSLLLLLISFQGIARLKHNSFFLDDLGTNSPLKKDMYQIEHSFGGIRPFELALISTKKEKNIITPQLLRMLSEIDDYLRDEYAIKMHQSLVIALKEANVAFHGGNYLHYKIPEQQKDIDRLLTSIQKNNLPLYNLMIQETGQYTVFRIAGKIKDLGAQAIRQKNEQLYVFMQPYQNTFKYQLTGAAHLMDQVNFNVSNYILKGIAVSLIVVFLILLLLVKSIRISLLVLLPNIFPLVIVAGFMGWLEIDLKIGTAMIFTVIFGIAVDDTIHFLMGYLSDQKNKSVEDKLNQTLKTTGKKLILTSLILAASFATFIQSDFQSTYYAGILVTLGIIVALFTDLIQLPILLFMAEKNRTSFMKRHLNQRIWK